MRLASALLIVSIGIGSGCGAARPCLPTPPVILDLPDCPAPARPALPRLNGGLPFDAPANVAALMERDDILRLHVKAQEAALNCYQKRTSP